MEQRSSKKQDSGGLCRGVRALSQGSGEMLKRVKEENDLCSSKEEKLLESNSRTLSSIIAHAGEKKTFFLWTKEMPFPPSPPLHLALAGTLGPQPPLSNPLLACLPNGSPALCRDQGGASGRGVRFLITLQSMGEGCLLHGHSSQWGHHGHQMIPGF